MVQHGRIVGASQHEAQPKHVVIEILLKKILVTNANEATGPQKVGLQVGSHSNVFRLCTGNIYSSRRNKFSLPGTSAFTAAIAVRILSTNGSKHDA